MRQIFGTDLATANQRINEKIQEIASKRETIMAIISVAWSFRKLYITAPITGMGSIDRVVEAVQAVEFELSQEEEESIDELYEPKKAMSMAV